MASKTEDPAQAERQAVTGPPPVHALAFTVLSLLVETAAGHLGASLPGISEAGETGAAAEPKRDLAEARLAIDAANALLSAVRAALEAPERMAIEGLLTQLQIEYVKRIG